MNQEPTDLIRPIIDRPILGIDRSGWHLWNHWIIVRRFQAFVRLLNLIVTIAITMVTKLRMMTSMMMAMTKNTSTTILLAESAATV